MIEQDRDIAEAPGKAAAWLASRAAVRTAAAALVVLGTVAYAKSFAGEFIFDDYGPIVDSPRIHRLGAVRDYVGMTRPVLELSRRLTYRFAGRESEAGWHLANLLIHLGCGLLLLGLTRRALIGGRGLSRFSAPFAEKGTVPGSIVSPWSLPIAWAIAAVWMVHPLTTQAVTYIVQRDESLTSLFYLLTLYGVARAAGSARPRKWAVLAVAACAVGMGCKEIIVTAPVMALLYDRTFLAGSFREALARRRNLYLALAGTWAILAAIVLTVDFGASAGFGGVAAAGAAAERVGPLQYAASQPEVILHYLRLAVWPAGLVFDYGWKPAATAGQIVPAAAAIVALLAGTVWALIRRPAAGFLGAWFFLILAPTSSFLPIADLAVEHRMYLPLAAVVALVVCGGFALGRVLSARAGHGQRIPESGFRNPVLPRGRAMGLLGCIIGGAAVVSVLAVLTVLTIRRNAQYADELGMWRDVTEKRPRHYRGFCNYGYALERRAEGERDPAKARQDIEQAITLYRQALTINAEDEYAMANLGAALVKVDRTDEAVQWLLKALEIEPRHPDAHVNLGVIRLRQGDPAAAARHLRAAVEAAGGDVKARLNLGLALTKLKDFEQAEQHFAQALHLRPDMPEAYCLAGSMYDDWGKHEQAAGLYQRAIELRPGYVDALERQGVVLLRLGHSAEGAAALAGALRAKPSVRTYQALSVARSAVGQDAEAVADLRRFLAERNNPPLAGLAAWLMATSPNAAARDGVEAVRLGEAACRATEDRDPILLDVLAAAYAEAGQFDRAGVKADQAAARAAAIGEARLAEDIRRRATEYRAGRPYRDIRPVGERIDHLLFKAAADGR